MRLSREDGDKEESDSIVNQKNMLSDYIAQSPEFKLYGTYVDDGYTGTNFDRPDFQRMEAEVDAGKINCVIVKDLSRLGRDYIGVGNYVENVYPRKDVRFISLNERLDSLLRPEEVHDIIIPFTNLMNEHYARDISRKVRSALDSKRRRGEFIGAFASYGYRKDPNNKNHLMIDEEVADNVRNIFKWFLEGLPKLSIAYRLNDSGIPCPSEYKKQKGLKYVNAKRLGSTNYWTHTSIDRILKSEVYIGNLVQHTQTVKSFKNKKNIQLDRSQWMIARHTHEPIIDRETWETAQRLLNASIKKSQFTGEVHLFAGLIQCADCGRAMKKRRSHNGKYEYYVCGTYMTYGKDKCESHSIRKEELEKIVFNEIKAQITKYLNFQELKKDTKFSDKLLLQLASSKKRLSDFTAKLEKAKALKFGLYGDYKENVISREEYEDYKQKYNAEIESLSAQINSLKKSISCIHAGDELKRSEEIILKYQNIQSLTREVLVSLVKSIVVHADQTITIHFSFIPM